MDIALTFKELVELVLMLPKLVKINAENRQRIRDAVGTVADELTRGLGLVQYRIEGAKVLARSTQPDAQASLQAYMAETTNKLFEAFSEFKICRGLRETRDRFVRPFDLAKAAVRRENIQKIDRLLHDLESDERLIIDEVGPLVAELGHASTGSAFVFLSLADEKLKLIEKRRAKLKRLARQMHESL